MFAGQIVPDKGEVLMITNKGFCKRLPVKDITRHARNCKGAKGIEFGAQNGSSVVYAEYVKGNSFNVALLDKANAFAVTSTEVAVESKNTKGKLPKGRKAVNVEKAVAYLTAPDSRYLGEDN